MSRRNSLFRALFTLPLTTTLLVGGTPALANNALPPAPEAVTPIEIAATGAEDVWARTDGRVVFRNLVESSTRIVFASKDAKAIDCAADGEEATRSRTSQYLLRGGAELSCKVRPGRYRYTTLTSQHGGVHKAKSILRVRN